MNCHEPRFFSKTIKNKFLVAVSVYVLCFIAVCKAQNTDSLLVELKKHRSEDSTKVRLIASIASSYRYTSPDSMRRYADMGIGIANSIKDERGVAQCLVAKTLSDLISGNLDEGLQLSTKAIAIFDKLHDSAAMANALFYIAAIHYNQSKFEESIQYYLKTVSVLRHSTDYAHIGDALDNVGICYSTLGKYAESLKYYLEGLKIREKEKSNSDITTSLGNIGRVYASLGNNEKAIEYINRSLSTQRGSSLEILMMNYENAGNVYLSVKDTVKALNAFETAGKMADSAKQPLEINRILCNTAEVYLTMKEYDKAYDLYQRCIKNTSAPNMPAVNAMIHRGLGTILIHRKKYKEGIEALEVSLNMFRENEMNDHYTNTLKNLAEAYAGAGMYDKAYNTLTKYDASNDSILNEQSYKKVQQLQYDYDLQKKQSQIEILAKDKTIAESKADKQKVITIGLISGLVLLSLVIGNMYRSKKKEQAAKDLILQQAEKLQELNNYKDKIFSVISHDIRGPISSLDSSLTLLDEKILSIGQFEEIKRILQQQLGSVTLLLDNLLKWSMANMTGGKANKSEVLDLRAIADQTIAIVQVFADEKKINITNSIPDGLTAIGDSGNVDIIIRNLISNAVKFTRNGGNITVSAEKSGNKTQISITDSGIGMGPAQVKKLFTIAPENSTHGTMGEKGIGLGLLMSYEFAKANKGDIAVTSELGKGSTFTLTLPA